MGVLKNLFGSPKAPAPPPPPPADVPQAAIAPHLADPGVQMAGNNVRAAGGFASTLLTSGQGLTEPASTTRKSLLGV